MIMAFGRPFENHQELQQLCKAVIELSSTPQWSALTQILTHIRASHFQKYPSLSTMEEVRENTGTISGLKKVLALPDECRQLLKVDSQNKEN